VLRSHSARGLSLPAYILETLAYAITTVYSWRNNYAFSTYGENLFLTIQNIVITFLIVAYSAPKAKKHALTERPASSSGTFVMIALGTLASLLALFAAPPHVLQLAQLSTLPLSLFSKLPQIAQNQRARSTGQLSAFAVFAQIAGCAARLFTNATEVGDTIQAAGFFLALVLNIVLGVQMLAFWGRDAEPRVQHIPLGEKTYERTDIDIVVPPQSPIALQTSHNIAPPAAPARRWARKID
jgi:mannose-P-dolichol utilization defect protein 1